MLFSYVIAYEGESASAREKEGETERKREKRKRANGKVYIRARGIGVRIIISRIFFSPRGQRYSTEYDIRAFTFNGLNVHVNQRYI